MAKILKSRKVFGSNLLYLWLIVGLNSNQFVVDHILKVFSRILNYSLFLLFNIGTYNINSLNMYTKISKNKTILFKTNNVIIIFLKVV